ncbi:MAG: helix-turn-helix transcriptional regulator [Bacteroidetes bacterium]|nr:helix-turn-helix transcriptional regulator [Bacteroidota bacterium]
MKLDRFPPSDILKPYVKYYWVCTTDEDVPVEIMYPSGHVEFCVHLSNGGAIRHFGNRATKMPTLEVLGHITKPTTANVTKGTTVLIARFHSYASSLFFPDQVSSFTNDSVDLCDILNKESTSFYHLLMEQNTLEEKIKVLDDFLVQRLLKGDKRSDQFKFMEHLCQHINKTSGSLNLENIVTSFGFSERYIQKLFHNWVGLTPKAFHSVLRFNKSLELIQTSSATLTSIAYECGYYDQAHFIKEFKSYSGITPSHAAQLHKTM